MTNEGRQTKECIQYDYIFMKFEEIVTKLPEIRSQIYYKGA